MSTARGWSFFPVTSSEFSPKIYSYFPGEVIKQSKHSDSLPNFFLWDCTKRILCHVRRLQWKLLTNLRRQLTSWKIDWQVTKGDSTGATSIIKGKQNTLTIKCFHKCSLSYKEKMEATACDTFLSGVFKSLHYSFEQFRRAYQRIHQQTENLISFP